MHIAFRCGSPALFRTGLSAASALSGAVSTFPLRQHLCVGYCQVARGRGRPAGAVLHAVFPLCLGGSAYHCCPAYGSATPHTTPGQLGEALCPEFRAFISALALPARRECPAGWCLGCLAYTPRFLGLRRIAPQGLATACAAHSGHPCSLLGGGAGLPGVLPPAGTAPQTHSAGSPCQKRCMVLWGVRASGCHACCPGIFHPCAIR